MASPALTISSLTHVCISLSQRLQPGRVFTLQCGSKVYLNILVMSLSGNLVRHTVNRLIHFPCGHHRKIRMGSVCRRQSYFPAAFAALRDPGSYQPQWLRSSVKMMEMVPAQRRPGGVWRGWGVLEVQRVLFAEGTCWGYHYPRGQSRGSGTRARILHVAAARFCL